MHERNDHLNRCSQAGMGLATPCPICGKISLALESRLDLLRTSFSVCYSLSLLYTVFSGHHLSSRTLCF